MDPSRQLRVPVHADAASSVDVKLGAARSPPKRIFAVARAHVLEALIERADEAATTVHWLEFFRLKRTGDEGIDQPSKTLPAGTQDQLPRPVTGKHDDAPLGSTRPQGREEIGERLTLIQGLATEDAETLSSRACLLGSEGLHQRRNLDALARTWVEELRVATPRALQRTARNP